jgi:Nuclease-related domain
MSSPKEQTSGSVDEQPPTVVDVGDPGGSLQAQYEQRSGAREARVRERSPRIGGFLLPVFPDPASTTAFSKGAEGERRVAARLAELAGPGVLFLHNRKLGRGRRDGDVDHMALTAGGVYVIDTKLYKNAKIRVRRTGGLFSPVREQLMVNGRDRSKLLDSVARQKKAVRQALSTFQHPGATGDGIPVISVLCFVDADLPIFGTPRVDGVPLLGPRGTARILRKATGALDQDTLAALHRHLAQAMPTA